MTRYEKNYKAFNKLIARNIYTVEAGLAELAAAHKVSAGYGPNDREAASAWKSAVEKWEAKWEATPQYNEIIERWLA